MADTLDLVARPSLKQQGDPPEWVSQRGQDVRAYDRRQERLVFGPGHPFSRTTDLMVMNGLVRFWVGNRNSPAYVNLEVFLDGSWKHAGFATFTDADETLESAALVRCTPDHATVRLQVQDLGPAYVSMRRGERGLRIGHGVKMLPSVNDYRTVKFLGTPPEQELKLLNREAGHLNDGLSADNDESRARFWWPQDVPADAWSIGVVWLPDAASIQFDSKIGEILAIEDGPTTPEVVGRVYYDGSDDRLKFELGSQTVQSDALPPFDSGELIYVVARFSTEDGMSLSHRLVADAVTNDTYVDTYTDSYDGTEVSNSELKHAHDATATDPGATEDAYWRLGFGPTGNEAAFVGGIYDQAEVFSDRLTDAEAEAILQRTHRGDGLPSPEGRLVWAAPFDSDPILAAVLVPSASHPDDDGRADELETDSFLGAKRTVVALRDPSIARPGGLGLSKPEESFEAGAYVATGDAEDDTPDVQEQFAADQEQEVRAR